MTRFGVSCVAALFWTGTLVLGDPAKDQKCPVIDDADISQEKLEATIQQLMENLKKEGFSEEELLNRVERDADGKIDKRSYEEKFRETCGCGPLTRCPREFKPVEGHICENVEPIEPRGPFCNCPFCSGKDDSRKEIRETDFEETEALKSETARLRMSTSIYQDKWGLMNKLNSPASEEKKMKLESLLDVSEEVPRRNLFSCQRTEPIYDAEKAPILGDRDFQEQLKSMTEEEQPSLGLLKYHEKRSREEGEL